MLKACLQRFTRLPFWARAIITLVSVPVVIPAFLILGLGDTTELIKAYTED